MRTTLTLDDRIANSLQDYAQRQQQSFQAVVEQALRLGLGMMEQPPTPSRYRLTPVSLGALRPGLSLDQTMHLAAQLDDEALLNTLDSRP